MHWIDAVYLLGWVVTSVYFVRLMIDKWWEAQGRERPFEFGGAVWALAGGIFFAFFWPVTLTLCLAAKGLAFLVNAGATK